MHRLAHELPGQFLDALRVSGREQQGLPLFRALFGNRGDVIEKAHVQHAVGLVQDEHFDVRQVDRSLPHVVHQSAGSGHDDVDAAAKRGELALDAHAAIDGRGPQRREAAVLADGLLDLHCQLSRWSEDQAADRALGVLRFAVPFRSGHVGGGFVAEPVEDRQHECGGFARSRLGTADNVFAADRGGNGPGLDLRRGRVAGREDSLHQRVGETEFREWHSIPLQKVKPRRTWPQSSKHEIRNPKQIQMTEIQKTETLTHQRTIRLAPLDFGHSCLFRISSFDIRAFFYRYLLGSASLPSIALAATVAGLAR